MESAVRAAVAKPEAVPETKLAWMAAILDFQGLVMRKNNKTRATPQFVLYVGTTNHAIVAELCRLTGSHVEPHESRSRKAWMRRGCVTHCPEPDVEYPEQPEYLPAQSVWTLTGAAAVVVLCNVIPYMVTDKGFKTALEEMLPYVNLHGRSGNGARQAVHRLRQLGWKLPPKIARQYREVTAA